MPMSVSVREVSADDELLTPDDVSRETKIPKQTLANWRSTRRYDLAFVKIGNRIRYRRRDVRAFIDSRVVSA